MQFILDLEIKYDHYVNEMREILHVIKAILKV